MSDATPDSDRTTADRSAGDAGSRFAAGDDRTIGQIISDITDDFRNLFRDEVALAKAEFNEALRKLIMGAVLLAIGGVLANTGLNALVASAVLGLSDAVAPWLAALIVGIVIIVIGGILAMAGMRNFSAAQLRPERTMETLQGDARAVKEGIR